MTIVEKKIRTCRVCGCTDDNACLDELLDPCYWVAEDLCSAHLPVEENDSLVAEIEVLYVNRK